MTWSDGDVIFGLCFLCSTLGFLAGFVAGAWPEKDDDGPR